MTPGRSRRDALIYAAAILFAAALCHRFYKLGGLYFAAPQTIWDHVSVEPYPVRDVVLLARESASLIPRGATLTAILPSQAPEYDVTLWLTAAGVLPRHRVIAPQLDAKDPASVPQYILAVRAPLAHPSFHLYRELPHGRVYEINR